jgi:diguanylate cyclase (GGDEF)-like protein
MELQRKNVELQEISFTDSLTGLWNRRYLEEVLAADAGLAVRNRSRAHEHATGDLERHSLVFLMVDVDSFKKVNDDYGHAVGDELLRKVAKRLSGVVRKSDLLVRWGGEEFLIMSRSAQLLGVPVFCSRILNAIASEPFDLGNNVHIRKTCSVGWASYPWCGDAIEAICPEEAIELADAALYNAKASGRNQSVGYVPSDIAVASPERINHESLREERSSMIKTIRTSSQNQFRAALSASE